MSELLSSAHWCLGVNSQEAWEADREVPLSSEVVIKHCAWRQILRNFMPIAIHSKCDAVSTHNADRGHKVIERRLVADLWQTV